MKQWDYRKLVVTPDGRVGTAGRLDPPFYAILGTQQQRPACDSAEYYSTVSQFIEAFSLTITAQEQLHYG